MELKKAINQDQFFNVNSELNIPTVKGGKVIATTFKNQGNTTVQIQNCTKLAPGESITYSFAFPYYDQSNYKIRFLPYTGAGTAFNEVIAINQQEF